MSRSLLRDAETRPPSPAHHRIIVSENPIGRTTGRAVHIACKGDFHSRRHRHREPTSVSASSEQTVAHLQALFGTTEQLRHSITQHSNTVVNDSKTVSLLRQQSAGQHSLHLVRTKPTPPPFSSLRCPWLGSGLTWFYTRYDTTFAHLILARKWRGPWLPPRSADASTRAQGTMAPRTTRACWCGPAR